MTGLKTNQQLFEEVLENGFDYSSLSRKISGDLKLKQPEERELNNYLRLFATNAKKRWQQVHRVKEKFRIKFKTWLSSELKFPASLEKAKERGRNTTPDKNNVPPIKTRKNFKSFSPRHRFRKTLKLRQGATGDELLFAAKVKLKAEGRLDMAKIINYLTKNPSETARILKCCKEPSFSNQRVDKNDALGVVAACHMSRSKYNALRDITKQPGTSTKAIFPSNYALNKSKSECYPESSSITITETKAKISMQGLLDFKMGGRCCVKSIYL